MIPKYVEESSIRKYTVPWFRSGIDPDRQVVAFIFVYDSPEAMFRCEKLDVFCSGRTQELPVSILSGSGDGFALVDPGNIDVTKDTRFFLLDVISTRSSCAPASLE